METFIGANTVVEGSIQTDRSITVQGCVQGRIESEGEVVVGNEGKIEADIYANSVVVGGQINGNVNAQSRVEITATGRVTGDVASPKVTIIEGGRVDGLLKMEQQDAAEHADVQGLIPFCKTG
jgi:cytoskeletal protein CcmA (bactofilin family)